MTMSSPLGDDQLIPISLSANEQISQTFTFDIRAVSQKGVIDPDTLLYQPCCITLQADEKPVRYFHGIAQSISAEGAVQGQDATDYHIYHITLVPRLWFLNQTVDCRVYQEDIRRGYPKGNIPGRRADRSQSDRRPASTREYTVQFNETDLHFATRLMEEEG